MRIVYKDSFVKRLEVQMDYLTQYKPIIENKFKRVLLNQNKTACFNQRVNPLVKCNVSPQGTANFTLRH